MIKYLFKRVCETELEEGFIFETDNYDYVAEMGYTGNLEVVSDLEFIEYGKDYVSLLKVSVEPDDIISHTTECKTYGCFVRKFEVLKEYPISSTLFIKDIFATLPEYVQLDIFEDYSLEEKLLVVDAIYDEHQDMFIKLIEHEHDLATLKLILNLLVFRVCEWLKLDTKNKNFNTLKAMLHLTGTLVQLPRVYCEDSVDKFSFDELGEIVTSANVVSIGEVDENPIFLNASPYYIFINFILGQVKKLGKPINYLEKIMTQLKSIDDIDYRKIIFIKQLMCYYLESLVSKKDAEIQKLQNEKQGYIEQINLLYEN